MSEPIEFRFSVSPEAARGIVDDIADVRESDDEEWEFTGSFTVESAIEIQASLQRQLTEYEVAGKYESYDTE